MQTKIGSRYQCGLMLLEYNTHTEGTDGADDHVVKTLFVKAVQDQIGNWELVAMVEVEVISIEDGNDEGELYPGIEVYRMPFPFELRTRLALLRLIRSAPKFFLS